MKNAGVVVKEMLDGILKGDAAAVMACFDPDVVVVEPESLAYCGVHRGLAAFQKDVHGVILSKLSIEIGRCELLGSEGKVAASMDITFTSRKTGQRIMMPYVEVYTVKNDKIAYLDVYPQDTRRFGDFWDAN